MAEKVPVVEHKKTVKVIQHGPSGFVYFLTFIGAAIYFISHSNGGFWEVILAVLQAIVWPVYVIYHVLQFLGV